MGNVINIGDAWKWSKADFTRELPEHDTLLSLCKHNSVKVFELEHAEHGYKMCFAYFERDGWNHLYHDGDGALSHHLFFWMMSWQGDVDAENVAMYFYENKFILCD